MSEPFLERMSRFTPDAGGLDRDALLFAAGRSSACPNRRWIALSSLLGGAQALTLVLLWPPPAPPPGRRSTVPVASVVVRVPTSPPPSSPAARVNSGLWTARQHQRRRSAETPPIATQPGSTAARRYGHSRPRLRS